MMNISAVFVVREFAIKKMMEKNEENRLDYLLGLGDDLSFESNLIDMEDFTGASEELFPLIQRSWPFLKTLDMPCLYDDAQCNLRMIAPKGEIMLEALSCSVDWQPDIEKVDEPDLYLSAYTSMEQAEQFMQMLMKHLKQNTYAILFFVK